MLLLSFNSRTLLSRGLARLCRTVRAAVTPSTASTRRVFSPQIYIGGVPPSHRLLDCRRSRFAGGCPRQRRRQGHVSHQLVRSSGTRRLLSGESHRPL